MDRDAITDAERLGSNLAAHFGEFYARHLPGISSYAALRLPRGELVFDVVAETFARVGAPGSVRPVAW